MKLSSATRQFYERLTGGLSRTSKMPGFSYGLPALKSCQAGTKLAAVPGTSCSVCYANKGTYQFPVVRRVQNWRLTAVQRNPSWTKAMIGLIGATKTKYFRWHDSGDLISPQHLQQIIQIAQALPKYVFWLPTQEHRLIRDWLKAGGVPPDNLVIRLSTPKINGRPVTTPLLGVIGTSTVHSPDNPAPHGHACPAHTTGNKCGTCRACWNREVVNVSYLQH